MRDNGSISTSIETGNLKNYFYQSLSEICSKQQKDTSDDSIAYIVNLLCDYSRSDRLFTWDKEIGYNLSPLALMYGDAVQTQDPKQRASALRRLGDVALFISGIFNASLTRKPVGIDYYINMGGSAYGWLSDNLETDNRSSLDHSVFRDLSERFSNYVRVLEEFAGSTVLRKDNDATALHRQWVENTNAHSEAKNKRGVPSTPITDNSIIH
jgi:hypothetical protein